MHLPGIIYKLNGAIYTDADTVNEEDEDVEVYWLNMEYSPRGIDIVYLNEIGDAMPDEEVKKTVKQLMEIWL